MRLNRAKQVAEENGFEIEYNNQFRIYSIHALDGRPTQWLPGQEIKNMSENTFKYFFLRIPLEEVIGDDLPEIVRG